MNRLLEVASEHKVFLGVSLALALTFVFWIESHKFSLQTPISLTPVEVIRVIPDSLTNFHGCPSGFLSKETMDCYQESGWLPRMVIRCNTTGFALTTEMVKGIPSGRKEFVTLQECGEASVVYWKPAHVAFGIRNLKIESMSWDLNQIIKLMCGDVPSTRSESGESSGVKEGQNDVPAGGG